MRLTHTHTDKKTAVVYTRVSTQQQVADGVSLEAQKARAHAWAQSMGYDVVGEYKDAGLSGKRADNRPGLQHALTHACREKAALVVYSLSRLARSTHDAIMIADRLRRSGADMVSLTEDINTGTAAGRMVFRLMASLSEFERDMISERTKTALAHKRARGEKTGGASPPFGFDVDAHGRLIRNEAESEAVTLVWGLREKGFTLRQIAEELETRGIITKTGGNKWHAKTVRDILKRTERAA